METEHNVFIIVGCGVMGGYLANALAKQRKSIIIIDRNESAFTRLNPDFSGFATVGDGTEEDVLLSAEINNADVVVATTGDDNTNIMIAQIARVIYHVPKVIARLYEPDRSLIYDDLGIETICPTILSLKEFSNMIKLNLLEEYHK